MSVRPSFQFYPRDWLTCLEVRRCSPIARALWMDLLCLMHCGEPYGHLCTAGKALEIQEIARVSGMTVSQVRSALAELERGGVFSRASDGSIFSRRMVRDEAARMRRAEGGKLGAEHGEKGAEYGAKGGRPSMSKGSEKPPSKPPSGHVGKPPPSSSSSSSSASPEKSQSSPTARIVGVAQGAPPPSAPRIEPVDESGSDPGPNPPPKAARPRKPAEPSTAASRIVSDTFCAAFERHRGERYVWQGGKDGKLLAALLAQFSGDVALIQRRIDAFLADPFWGPRADFATFCAKHNSVAGGELGTPRAPIGQRSVLDVIANAGRAPAGAA